MKENQIAALVEANGNYEAQVAKEAAAKIEENRRQGQIVRAQGVITSTESTLNSHLNALRAARTAEAKAKADVIRIGTALSEFKATGDIRVIAVALYPNSKADQDYYVTNNGAR